MCVLDDDQCSIVGRWKRHAKFPDYFKPFGHSKAFRAFVASSDPQSKQIILKIL